MAKWLEFAQTMQGIYIDVQQFLEKDAKGKMYCWHCEKITRSFPPSVLRKPRNKNDYMLVPPRWLKVTSFCAECGWMFKRHSIPAAVKREVSRLDRDECVYCSAKGRRGEPLEYDHVKPQILGGKATTENIVLACYDCNISKGGKEKWHKPQFGRFRSEASRAAVERIHRS